MDIDEYLTKMKSIQSNLLEYLNTGNTEEYYLNLIKLFEDQKIRENKHELKSLMFLLLKVSNDHYRGTDFFSKIEKLFLLYKNEIKQSFSSTELFNTFKNSKRLLLFLIRERILELNDNFTENMTSKKCRHFFYLHYLYPDVKPFISKPMIRKIEKDLPEGYEEKRLIGENDNEICQIIRKDSIEEFKTFCEENNVALNSHIHESIFETNPFLLENESTLIGYAAFYGSINIFKYLLSQKIELIPSLWLFAIHGRNVEIIETLVKNEIKPEERNYDKCLEEAIKCHHNEIVDYLKKNLIAQETNALYVEYNYNRNEYAYAYHYYNYECFIKNIEHRYSFFYFCQYDYYTLVILYLKKNKFYPNMTVISKTNYFFLSKSFYQFNILNGISIHFKK